MKLKEIKEEINRWFAVMHDVNTVVDSITDYTGGDLDSPMLKPICAMMSAYTNEVSKSIGDEGDYLTWYWLDCDMGKDPKRARLAGWTEFKTIKTTSDLARLIYEGHQ